MHYIQQKWKIKHIMSGKQIKQWSRNYFLITLLAKCFVTHTQFSCLTLGLKNADKLFMPVLSTLARLFWAAVIFFSGWDNTEHILNIRIIKTIAQYLKLSKKNAFTTNSIWCMNCWMIFLSIDRERKRQREKETERERDSSAVACNAISFNACIINPITTVSAILTHFSCKISTVELGVVFPSLYWFIWQFPFLSNARQQSGKPSPPNDLLNQTEPLQHSSN